MTVARLAPIVLARASASCTVSRDVSTIERAAEQRQIKLERGDVEADGGDGEQPVVRLERHLLGHRSPRSCCKAPWLTTTPLGVPVEPEV